MKPIPFPKPPLEDDLVRVRAWHDEDLAARVEAWRDPDLMRFMLQPPPAQISLAAAREWLEPRERRRLAGRALFLVVADPVTDRALGSIWLWNVEWESRRAEVGYWLLRGARGRGRAARAADLLCRFAFERLGLERMELLTMPGNEASLRVAERAGFVREGVLRAYGRAGDRSVDLALYARLADTRAQGRTNRS